MDNSSSATTRATVPESGKMFPPRPSPEGRGPLSRGEQRRSRPGRASTHSTPPPWKQGELRTLGEEARMQLRSVKGRQMHGARKKKSRINPSPGRRGIASPLRSKRRPERRDSRNISRRGRGDGLGRPSTTTWQSLSPGSVDHQREGLLRALDVAADSPPKMIGHDACEANESEAIDPDAMRYLPKILRDTYAKRQKEHASMLGEAQEAAIDLCLQLQRPKSLPCFQDVFGYMLILNLSDFNALGERLRAELGPWDGVAESAGRINNNLSMIVQQVHIHRGDVLKFAGDSLVCLFEEKDYGEPFLDKWGLPLTTDQKTRRRVIDCCLSVLGHIPEEEEKDLSIRGGAAHGIIRCFFLGSQTKWPGSCAFVASGHPLKQARKLLGKAGKGEVYIDGEKVPLTVKEGVLFKSENGGAWTEDLNLEGQDQVMPRGDALLSDPDLCLGLVGGFEVDAHAAAYLGTLAALRCDEGSQDGMSMLLEELRPVATIFVGLHDLDDIQPRDSSLPGLMNDAFETLSRVTRACNGAVLDMLFDHKGCVFISVFGAHNHEVNPCFDATVSAMQMESALKDLELKRFSLGVSFGECFCSEVGTPMRSDYVVMGPEVHLAAKLMGNAPNRGTLVSKRVFDQSKSFIHYERSEEIQAMGKDELFHAYIPQKRIDLRSVEMVELGQTFVIVPSRKNAMDSLMQAKERVAKGTPTTTFVLGGPFLGKSRLINEVAGKASDEGFRILKSFRTPHDSFTSFFPFRRIVSVAMMTVASRAEDGENFGDEIATATYLVDQNILNKTDRVNIGSIVPTVADAQLLSLLSGLNPKARTRSAVDSLMKILKLLQPLMIIIEGDGDIDTSSWNFLAELMQRAGAECPQIMLIVSSRNSSTFRPASSNLRHNSVQVKLRTFKKRETEQYIRVLLGVESQSVTIDPWLLEVVHDRANGCPFYIECVIQWALDRKMIRYLESSKEMSLKMLDERSDDLTAALPQELSTILLAPFNKFSPPLWDALKIASCIGYSFSADLYSTLNARLDFMLKIRELSSKYDCFDQTGSHFRWKHQAVYEAVKSILTVKQRQKIHRMIVREFEQSKISYGEVGNINGGEICCLLGRHYVLAEDWAGAYEQYTRAGDRASAMFNFNEALKMYEEAIKFQAKLSEPPPPLQSRMINAINLGTCFRELVRYKEAETVLTRCLNEARSKVSEIAVDEELYVRALSALAALYQAQSKYDAARKLFEKAVPLARNIQESRSSLWLAGNIAGYAEILRKSGDLPQAERHHREALEIRTRAVEEKLCTELELAVSYTQLGCTLTGMRQYKEAYKLHHQALTLRNRYLDFYHGLVSESLNYCAESLCALGRAGEGIPLALHAVGIRKLIFGTSHPAYAHALSVLSSCYHAVGRYTDACDCLEKCLEICEVIFHKNHANMIPNLMNYGNVLRSTGALVKARSVYHRAIIIHQLNFKQGQQARPLAKCKAEVADLTEKIEELESSKKASLNVVQAEIAQKHLSDADVESRGTPDEGELPTLGEEEQIERRSAKRQQIHGGKLTKSKSNPSLRRRGMFSPLRLRILSERRDSQNFSHPPSMARRSLSPKTLQSHVDHRRNGLLQSLDVAVGSPLKLMANDAHEANPSEAINPNMMTYLPKILRDTYATRQTRHASILGEARQAAIDLGLRLRRPENLPCYQDVCGYILILNLSDFNALGERLRAELGPWDGVTEFAGRINNTLSMMVRKVHLHRGDVLKFAGNALVCFFEEKDYGELLLDEQGSPLATTDQKTRRRVRDCCLSVFGEIAEEEEKDLTVSGGTAHGIIRCFFLGTPTKRPGSCAFVASGHPLKQAGKLVSKAGSGEVYFDGEKDPITEKEGVLFKSENRGMQTEDLILEEQDQVMPRGDALLSDPDLRLGLVGGFEVDVHAAAYLGTLAALRCDEGSDDAMPMLLEELRPVATIFVGLHDLDDIQPRDSSLPGLMNDTFKTLSRITSACNGAVLDMLFNYKGCVFISVFGAHSHEVNPCFDATVSAMQMESALKDLELKRFSLGVSFGECFCGEVGTPMRSDYVVMGPEVHLAEKLMGNAPNRGTLVSKRVFDQSKSFIHYEKSEEIQVKGKDKHFRAYLPQKRIDRQSVEMVEPQQRFVSMPSRKNAMDSLMQAKLRASWGMPTITFVSGGPFLGKSRMINEVAGKASDEGFRILKSFRTSLDSFTSFSLLRRIVSEAMIMCVSRNKIRVDIGNEITAIDYLMDQNILNETDRVNIGSILPTVANAQVVSLLSGLKPKARMKSVVESLMKILKLLQPLIIIVEGDGDIDPPSWSVFAELMQRAAAKCPQLMLIVSSRDSLTIPATSNLRQSTIQVKLVPFENFETEQYIRVLLGMENQSITIDPWLLEVVHDRANGCPLFIECVIRWVIKKNVIEYLESSKKMSLKILDERSDDLTQVIPQELSNILLAPFNKLSPKLWDVLKIASCIGYSFNADQYNTLNPGLDFMSKIRELSSKYDCFDQTGSHLRWKQQAVYEAVKSLLMTNQRQEIHRMIVREFQQNEVDDGEVGNINGRDICCLLGQHCALAEDWVGAFAQYMRAGDHAKAMFNFNEALKMYQEAIDCQSKMRLHPPPLRSSMIPTINLGTCLRELARYKEAESVLKHCLNECQSNLSDIAVDEELYVRALTALATLYQAQSEYDAARKLFEKAVPIARNIQESRSSLWLAGNIAGYAETLRKSGDLPQAERYHREALEIRTRAVEEKLCTELELAVSYSQLGCTLAGMQQSKEAYKQHCYALALRYRYLDFSHGLVSESLNYCAESLCALGRAGEGIPLALHGIRIRKLIFGTSHPAYAHALSVLASCYHAVGRYTDACDCLDKCLEICEFAFRENHANMIPNLMNYGNVLRSTGALVKARTIYQHAITIHQLNFKQGQQARQFEKCKAEVADLTEKIEELDSSVTGLLNDIPAEIAQKNLSGADIESQGTPIVVFTDIGRDVDDELALVLLSALKRKHILNPIAVITALSPDQDCAHLARGSMDSMGMHDVPVGIGSHGGLRDGVELKSYGADYSRSGHCIFESGMELVCRALGSVSPKSAVLLCITHLSDAASLVREHEDLFISKVKELVIMDDVVSTELGESPIPDSALNDNYDLSSAKFLYKKCQELGVPTATLSRWSAYGCPTPPRLLDEMAKTEHMVATNIRSVSKLNIDQLWNKVILRPPDPRRGNLPKQCDVSWFCRTFMAAGEISKEWSSSVWTLVKKLNMYDPLAVLLCVPAYRATHFDWKSKVVHGVSHIVVGTSERDTGIKNRLSLYNEYSSLISYAFQESLHKQLQRWGAGSVSK